LWKNFERCVTNWSGRYLGELGSGKFDRKVRPLSVNTGSAPSRSAVVLDPHPLWLDAVEQILERIHVTVVAKTTTTAAALEAVADHEPDLLVAELDDEQPGLRPLECLRQALERRPSLKIVVLSGEGTPDHISRAFAAGAAAYVVKTAQPDDLCAAVRQAFDHSVYFPAGFEGTVPSPVEADTAVLTRRELEILQLVAEGHSNAQVGRQLWVTEQTVKFHLSNIYRKLDVANRTEASRWAQVRNLLPQPGAREAAPPLAAAR
jgi:DNA-binding NarL/FixJ family response regulator